MDGEACEALLEAARDEDETATREAVGRLFPDLRSLVDNMMRGQLRRMAAQAGWDGGDVTSAVVEKLLRNPPRGSSNVSPVAAVKAWVRATALHATIDARRRQEARREDTLAPDDTRLSDPAPLADAWVAASDAERELRAMLEACYPRGVPLFEHTTRFGEDDDAALAERWGTTVANVQRQRTRMRRYCAAYRALSRAESVDDETAARAMDAELNDENRRIIAGVRHHLAKRRRSP